MLSIFVMYAILSGLTFLTFVGLLALFWQWAENLWNKGPGP